MSHRDSISDLTTRRVPRKVRGKPGLKGAPVVPGYEMVRLVGKGGMGMVWEAFEQRLERKVALKVHRGTATPEKVAQLWAEAKLAARIAHPGVVSVHDVGTTLEGQPYYTMDLIEGTSLLAALREGPVPPLRALAVAIEVADAVAAAHACGIVHCDLKPGNVLIDAQGRVRILDFGIAERRGEERDRSVVLGSPPYMSPERINAEAPTVASDVYSIGVMLYEMIVGRRPFMAESKDELLLAILETAAPPLLLRGVAVHPDIERVYLRCLEKRPEARFSSARALREALVSILEGRPLPADEPTAMAYVPRARVQAPQRTKLSRESADYQFQCRFVFDAPPERIWPFMVDTDQVARASGWQPITAGTKRAPEGHVVLTGSFRMGGLTVAWEDDPYAWVRQRELSQFKRFDQGPFLGSWSVFALRPVEGGRTEVSIDLRMLVRPGGVMGWLVPRLPLKFGWSRMYERFFRQIAALVAANETHQHGFYEPAHKPSSRARAHVEKGAAHLIQKLRFPEAWVRALANLLLYGHDKQVERLRPFALADAWGARREEVLDLFLHAGSVGLVDIAWDMICADCRLPYEMVTSLGKVAREGACVSCGAAYEGDLAR